MDNEQLTDYDEFDPMDYELFDGGERSDESCPECGDPLYIYYIGHMAHGDDYYTKVVCKNCDFEDED